MHLNFKSNEYTDLIDHHLYDLIPKTVMAAIIVSFIIRLEGEEMMEKNISGYIFDEWKILYRNKIVPQLPPKSW